VGGIQANLESPADFSYDNLAIAVNVIHSAQHFGTRRLLYFSSSCVYPRDCRQPMHETDLWSGPPEPSSEPYATAKLAGMSLCRAVSAQYGVEFFAVIPPNLYGPGDNYDPERSHVMAALIRKFHEAKVNDAPEVVLWGTGEPRRDMMYVDDAAEAAVLLMERYAGPEPVNVGTGEDRPIAHLAGIVAGVVGYTGRVTFDTSKPNGAMRKLMDVSRLTELGYTCNRSLTDGIRLAYDDYLKDAQP
jgi:GDP-L-fucose synthase